MEVEGGLEVLVELESELKLELLGWEIETSKCA